MKFLVVLTLASAALAAPLPPAGPAYASSSDNYPSFAVRHVQSKPECDNATTVSAEGLLTPLAGLPLLGGLFGALDGLLAPVTGLLPMPMLEKLPILGDLLGALLGGGGAKGMSVESVDEDGNPKNGTQPALDPSEIAAARKVIAAAALELSSAILSISAAEEATSMLSESTTATITDAPTSTADVAGVDETATETVTSTETAPEVEPTDVDFSFSAHIGEGKKEARL